MTAATPEWAPSVVHLKCLLGEQVIARFAFAGQCPTARLLFDDGCAQRVMAEGYELPAGVDVRYAKSLPQHSDWATCERRGAVVRYTPRRYSHSVVSLRRTAEEFWSSFSSKSRSTLQRKRRRLREQFGDQYRVIVATAPHQIAHFLAQARTVSSTSYQELLLHAGIPSSESYRSRITQLAANGCFRGFLLCKGDTPISYLACPIVKGVAFYEHVGYDPAFRELSPGTVLLIEALEQLMAEGTLQEFDFTEGDGEHKRQFATASVACADVYWFRIRPKAVAAIVLHRSLALTSKWIARATERIGMKRALKRLIRRQAPPLVRRTRADWE